MPRFILKYKDIYMLWSTIVDAPIDVFRTESALVDFMRFSGVDSECIDEQLDRLEEYGTSCKEPTTAEELAVCNRAGPGEIELTLEEIYRELIDDLALGN